MIVFVLYIMLLVSSFVVEFIHAIKICCSFSSVKNCIKCDELVFDEVYSNFLML